MPGYQDAEMKSCRRSPSWNLGILASVFIMIDLDEINEAFLAELKRHADTASISACFACRTCTASCPASEVTDRFNPARIIRMALYGLKDRVLQSDFVWLCTSCYACQERCPQGVRITDFMTVLKNMAVKEGHIPAGIKAQMDLIHTESRIYPLDDFDNKKRKKAGLPELPTSCEVVKKLLD
jgi:heterodisulfide reductase subunit C